MHSSLRVHNDIDAVEEHIELSREYTEELLHHGHIEEVLRFIVLRKHVGGKLLLRVEHHSVLAAHERIGNGTPDGCAEPFAETVHFIDAFFVRQVRLHEQFDVPEADEGKSLAHTSLVVCAEESMRVSALLTGLELAEDWVL